MTRISVSKQFSSTPGGRFRIMGPDSGEEFRSWIMRELKKRGSDILEISLDGPEGYGSSFLEEAFGGLIRNRLLSPDEASRRIKIVTPLSLNKTYVDEATQYMFDAAERLK